VASRSALRSRGGALPEGGNASRTRRNGSQGRHDKPTPEARNGRSFFGTNALATCCDCSSLTARAPQGPYG
jgi:hypothetical protein